MAMPFHLRPRPVGPGCAPASWRARAAAGLLEVGRNGCQIICLLVPVLGAVAVMAAPEIPEAVRRWSSTEPAARPSAVLRLRQTRIFFLAWTSEGTALAVADQNGQAAWYPLAESSWQETAAVDPAGDDAVPQELYRIAPVALTRDGTMVASGQGRHVTVRAVADGRVRAAFQVDAPSIKSLAFAPDGATLAVGCVDGSVVVWDVGALGWRATLHGHPGIVNGLAFAPDGRLLASAGNDGTLCVWDAATGRLRSSARSATGVRSVAFAPDGRTIATCGIHLTLWDAATGRAYEVLDRLGGYYSALDYSPDGRWLAAAAPTRGTLTIWDLASPGRRAVVRGPVGAGFALAFAPDGRTLASGREDGMIELWTVREVFGRDRRG